MISLHPANQRGHAQHGWLESWHSFSFGDYYDPTKMGFASLRVINDDYIAPSAGFPTHPHRDMEIITYVLSGELAHQDSMGNGSTIYAGDVQKMSAGTGIKHSEFNPSADTPVHLLQIWIQPAQRGVTPSYAQIHVSQQDKQGKFCLIAAPEHAPILLHQDVKLYAAMLNAGETLTHQFAANHLGYLHVATGSIVINKQTLNAGDALSLENETSITISTPNQAEILLFDINSTAT
ncbi:MAG: pirin family protein [Sulfuriferula sp.]